MANDIRAWAKLFELQWRNAASLRASFAVQTIGMMVNNGGIAIAWVLFISVFGDVNGWRPVDVIGSQGIGSLSFGLAYAFCQGAAMFAQDIRHGTFDGYFLRPLRILPLVWRSQFSQTTFGDILFGILLIVIACVFSSAPSITALIAVLVAIPAAMIMVALSTITNSYSFWFPEDRGVGDMLFRLFISPSMYPAGAFSPVMRIIFSVFIPSLLVAGVPWEAARDHAAFIVASVWFAGFAWLGIAWLVFRAGLKRYESGGTGR